jgi:3'(2'), 5'-bisphosphate nucleotidase
VINIEDIVNLSHDAGKLILDIYQSDNFEKQLKSDNSPSTKADIASHNLIVNRLRELTPNIPILSEESTNIAWKERKIWQEYWLIDPLDGTKEFIKKNGEFTVNIALIKDNAPVLGVVHAPVLDTMWAGEANKPAIKITSKGRVSIKSVQRQANETWNVVGSRSHQSDEFRSYVDKLEGEINIVSMGSSIKLCLVAEGAAHVYPRLGLTSEWDTAAAHAVVNSAGGKVVDVNTGEELRYNTKESFLNPFFIVSDNLKCFV